MVLASSRSFFAPADPIRRGSSSRRAPSAGTGSKAGQRFCGDRGDARAVLQIHVLAPHLLVGLEVCGQCQHELAKPGKALVWLMRS
jgi:hypothetical protein